MPGEVACITDGLVQVVAGFQQAINVVVVSEYGANTDGIDLHPKEFLKGGGFNIIIGTIAK